MKDASVEKEILDENHKLGKGQQAEVLEFVRSLTKSEMGGILGKTLLRFAGTIDREDLDKMAEAIQADCESVDPQEINALSLERWERNESDRGTPVPLALLDAAGRKASPRCNS